METMSQVIYRLRNERGYSYEITPKMLGSTDPSEWRICKIYRFEENTDPSDNSILYSLESEDGKRKSIIINAYGACADTRVNEFINKLAWKSAG